jgi:ABC-type antimicrobial peptide transport system permease subunit
MLKLYLLLVLRKIRQTRATFYINLIGLSLGLTSALLIYLWVYDEMNVDRFHENDGQLYMVMQNIEISNGIVTLEVGPNSVAQTLVEEMPEVELGVNVFEVPIFGKPNLSFQDNKIKGSCIYAGKDFFKVFSYNLIEGKPDQVFADANSIVISDEVAMKLFGTSQEALGQFIDYRNESQYLVSGIFKTIPASSSMQFDFLLSNDKLTTEYPSMDQWQNNTHNAYIVIAPGTDIATVNNKIASLIERKCGESNRTLFLKPYSDRYLYNSYEDGVQAGGRIEYVRLFSAIAIFILLMACINFINLSTAKASGRTREIGMRKVLGASRGSLAFQHLSESLLMAFLSLGIAIVLIALLLPRFNLITEKQLTFHLNSYQVLFFLGVTLITGLVAGSYPALYFSAFKPVRILKKQFRGSRGELWTRRGLVIFQFGLSIVLIVSVLVVNKQIEFIRDKDLGFNLQNVLVFDMEGEVSKSEAAFLSEIRKIPGIENASSSMFNIIDKHLITGNVQWEGKDPDDKIDFHMQPVSYDFIETLGIRMKEGRAFSEAFGADHSNIICNEAAIDIMGIKDPVGKTIKVNGKARQIIGVTENFHFESLHKKVEPLIFELSESSQNMRIEININPENESETLNRLQLLYEQYNPGFVFDYTFLGDENQALYTSEKRVGILSRYFAVLAIVISCLGLFGLAAYSSEKRAREIGIRKVFGASIPRIVYLLCTDFTVLVVISILIALPSGYLITSKWLNAFAYRTRLEWWYLFAAGLLALVIVWLTVGVIAIKTANVNPANCLREE